MKGAAAGRTMAEVEEESPVIPGLPADVGKLCLAKLPLDAVARSRTVCRVWASALRKYPAARLPHALAYFILGHEDDRCFTWLFLSRYGLRTHLIPSFFLSCAQELKTNIFTSRMQVIPTGTPMLLVRATCCLGATSQKSAIRGKAHDRAYDGFGEGHVCGPGSLQGFDLWRMQWLTPSEVPWCPMPVDGYNFANAYLGKHVYFAAGDGFMAANCAERLSLETWAWETLPQMHVERKFHPSGFAINGRFFVVGGEPHSLSSTLPQSGEFYDPKTNSWTLVPNMWPNELWWTGGGTQSVTVVNDVAYAIDAKLQAVLQLKVEEQPFSVRWHVVGKLPWAGKASTSSMQCLVSEGKDKLWAILKNRNAHQWFVFACTPHLGKQELVWEHLQFVVPALYQHTLSLGAGISI